MVNPLLLTQMKKRAVLAVLLLAVGIVPQMAFAHSYSTKSSTQESSSCTRGGGGRGVMSRSVTTTTYYEPSSSSSNHTHRKKGTVTSYSSWSACELIPGA